ncbi:MAG: hypothetical protein AMXMBFR13_47680 [Phycisphaerae bacterium]
MKQSRRHELKTNELRIYLQQMYATASRNASYILGGVAVVILVIALGLYIKYRQNQAEATAWSEFEALRQEDVSENTNVLEKARQFAAQHSEDPDLGPQASLLAAEMAYRRAMDAKVKPEQRVELLKDTRQRYEQMIQRHADRPSVVRQARMSLAAVEESLLMYGESTLDQVRERWQAVASDPDSPYQSTASENLTTLEQRTRKLETVATRPAAQTRPAPLATAPAAATAPGATVAQPAVVPPPAPAEEAPPAPPPATATGPG